MKYLSANPWGLGGTKAIILIQAVNPAGPMLLPRGDVVEIAAQDSSQTCVTASWSCHCITQMI